MNNVEFVELSRDNALNLLIAKRLEVNTTKNILEAEIKVYRAVSKFVNNDDMVKLGSWQNVRKELLEQINNNLNLAIRYLRDNEIDSIVLSYLKNYKSLKTQYIEKNSDKYYLSLKNEYIENACQFLSKENSAEV